MQRCSGIKPSGGRCERIVSAEQTYCYGHDPARQAERRRNAARGGKVKATGEISRVKASLHSLATATLDGTVDKSVAAVTSQIWNVYLSAVRTELKAREQLELIERLEMLEEALEQKGARRGA